MPLRSPRPNRTATVASDAYSWTYTTLSNRTATRTFRTEYNLIGDRFVELLAAAKRCGLHKAPNTIVGLQDAVKSLARAIKVHAPRELDVNRWEAAQIAYLTSMRVSERTRHS